MQALSDTQDGVLLAPQLSKPGHIQHMIKIKEDFLHI